MSTIRLTVNGILRKVDADDGRVLLDLLRQDLSLTGTKQSCDRKGQCGACTVLVNGKAVRSCLTKIADLEGAEVISIEGLGYSRESAPHPRGIRVGWRCAVRFLHAWHDHGDQGVAGPQPSP